MRLMFVHAHPDDESSQTCVAMASNVAAGNQVTLVTCTLGERGDVAHPDLNHLKGEALAAHRLGELSAAMEVLGVDDFVRLGGDGRWHDSGMEHSPEGGARPLAESDPRSFWRADLLEATDELVALIRDRRPHVLVTYDPHGGYGHPDHIQAHRVSMYAHVLAASPHHRHDLGEPWQVRRVLWSAWRGEDVRAGIRAARAAGIHDVWEGLDPDHSAPPMGVPDECIAAHLPSGDWAQQCIQALTKHVSQVNMDDSFWRFWRYMLEDPDSGESYVLVAGEPFPDDSWQTDLCAGLIAD